MQDFGPLLNAVMWTQIGIALLFVALRIYTRHYLIRNVGWDDLLMVINFATFVGFAIAISTGVAFGVGKQISDIHRLGLDNAQAIKWEAVGQAICIMGIAASKSSVALFLLRIVRETWHIALLWFCIVSTTIIATITTVLLFLQCRPAAFLWDQTIPNGVCWFHNFVFVALTMGAWSAVMDFVLAILPWHVIISLNMKRKEKITIVVGLSLGVFAGICSIVRTVKLRSLSSMDEYVYRTATMLLWSSSEICLTIICACIPVLRPLYTQLRYGCKNSDEPSGPSYPLEKSSNMVRNNRKKASSYYFSQQSEVENERDTVHTTVTVGTKTSMEGDRSEIHPHSGESMEYWKDAERGLEQSRDIIITTTVESRTEHA